MDKKKFKVEKNVPIPVQNYREARYPFDDMQVQDSFLVPTADFESRRVKSPMQSLRGSIKSYCRRHADKSFKVFKVKEGFRVWRTT